MGNSGYYRKSGSGAIGHAIQIDIHLVDKHLTNGRVKYEK